MNLVPTVGRTDSALLSVPGSWCVLLLLLLWAVAAIVGAIGHDFDKISLIASWECYNFGILRKKKSRAYW